MSFQAQLSRDLHTHTGRSLLKTIVIVKRWPPNYLRVIPLFDTLFSHEVEIEFYIPNHEKSHLDCLRTEPKACSQWVHHHWPQRLESKSARKQAWSKCHSGSKICPVNWLLHYHLQMGSPGANTNHSLSTKMGFRNCYHEIFFFSGGSEKLDF